MDQGDDYASNFMVILPMEDLTKDDTKFEVNMKTYAGGKSKRTVYHSLDAKTWHEVDDVFIDEKSGMASFDASKGKFTLIFTRFYYFFLLLCLFIKGICQF